MKIINLIGKKNSGKTYIAGELTKVLLSEGYSVYNDTFASKLKEIIAKYFGVRKNNFTNAITNFDDIQTNVYNMLVKSGIKSEALISLLKDYEQITINIKLMIDAKDSRSLMQYIGTEIFRKDDEEYWTRYMKIQLENLNKVFHISDNGYWEAKIDFMIISDCRFINEFEMLNSLNNIKTYNLFISRLNIDETDNHQSEKEVEDILKFKNQSIKIFNNVDDKQEFDIAIYGLVNLITV